MAYHSLVSLAVVFEVLFLLALIAFAVWAWGHFLDKNEHDPARVRAVMFLGLLGATTFELGLVGQGFIHPWVARLSLVINVWGGFDAVLRFPAGHDLESLFSAKQFSLLTLKTIAYTFGMVSFRQSFGLFMLINVTNIWLWPVFYAMALPMDPAEQVAKDDASDVDIVVRLYRLAASATERREVARTSRTWWYRRLAAASEGSSIMRLAICAASPEHRRIFKKMGRSV